MGILDFAKKQLIPVLSWTESADGVLSYRYPMQDRLIQNGGQLTVTESQLAMFVNEGTVADVFAPGLHALHTQNLPILTALQNWAKGFNSPFKSDVFFFSTRDQLDRKWGSPQPITVRDKEFGAIRIRAFGSYSYKVADPKKFFLKASGTRELYTVEELDGQLRAAIVTRLGVVLGGGDIAFVDMASNQLKFSETLKGGLAATFDEFGLALQSFFVQSISLPEELQTYLDKASSMRLVGDLQKYAQFQSADAIAAAAANGGGLAGAGAGLGAGMAIGQTMAAALGQGAAGGAKAPGAPQGSPSPDDAMATLGKLHELLKSGILTQAEFDTKKAELLKKIT